MIIISRIKSLIHSSILFCAFLSTHAFGLADEIKGQVYSIALQADSKVLVGGTFYEVNDVSRMGIARLNADGTLDTTFNPGDGVNGIVLEIALQADGKILIGGGFDEVNGISRHDIARLNADGSLDSTFSPVAGENNWFKSLILQPDDKILLGGRWRDPADGLSKPRLLRLNSDGSVDSTFNSIVSYSTDALALQPDGKVIVGGFDLVRLNADGSLDSTFDSGDVIDSGVWSLALQPDGKILVGRSYSDQIIRLNANGSVDPTFVLGDRVGERANAIVVLSSGKILFSAIRVIKDNDDDGLTPALARLNADGSLDPTFGIVYATGNASTIYEIVKQPNDKLLVGGVFNRLNRAFTPGVARLNANGTLPLGDSDELCLPIKALKGNIAVVCL